ncbi:MAG: ABC transporter ATP-binding protein [Spirochaetales bacterium]|nr:ABC transporter ATP-binding protein [Spirochaetales bacterium]
MAFLEVRELTLDYSTPRGPLRAVDSVSFSMEKSGTGLGLIGETGSGKSSLVMALARILSRNVSRYSGEVFLDGKEIMGLSNDAYRRSVRWKQISVVFQGSMNGFNPVMKIGKQLTERMLLEPGADRNGASEKVLGLLKDVGLSPEVFDRYPHELSGGMKQRVAIAMALCLDPRLMILDEPTSALDVSVQAQIMNLLKKLKWELGISMIFVTHDIALASEISDDLGVMYAGQLREFGSAEDVMLRSADPYTRDLLASIPRLHGGVGPKFVSGMAPDPIDRPAGCRFRERCSLAFERCVEDPPLRPVGGGAVGGAPAGSSHVARCWLVGAGSAS